MPTRYFRKVSPKIKLWMFGRPIQFHIFGDFAYIASDDPLIHEDPKIMAEIDRGIRDGQGGVIEIKAAQYESEFVKKKALSSSYPESNHHWREEVRSDTATPDTLAPKQDQSVRRAAPSESSETAPATPGTPARSLRDRAKFNQ